jgi:methionine biosynthesis protein MetW
MVIEHHNADTHCNQDPASPPQDENVTGLLANAADPLRYERCLDDDDAGAIIVEMIPVKSRVLDVGCGTGVIAARIRDARQADIIGIEPNRERATFASARDLKVYSAPFTEKLLQGIGLFDVIVFADVLEHVEDPASLLRTAKKGLRPGGVIIASIPNVAHWSVRWGLMRGHFDYQDCGILDATHLRWFTKETVKRLFVAEGLTIVEYRATCGFESSVYLSKWLWRAMPPRFTRPIIQLGALKWPGLFAYQHVVKVGST